MIKTVNLLLSGTVPSMVNVTDFTEFTQKKKKKRQIEKSFKALTSFPVTLWPPSLNHRPGTIAEKYGPQTPGTNTGFWFI